MPVHYNNKPNGVYANSMGNRPGSNQGVKYNRPNNGNNYQGNAQTRPANQPNRPAGGNNNNGQVGNNVGQRPGNTAGGANNNWKGQSTYQGNKTGGANGQTRPGSVNTGAPNTRPG